MSDDSGRAGAASAPAAPAVWLSRQLLFRIATGAIFILLLWQLAHILRPFLAALAAAATLVLIVHPVHARLLRLLKGRTDLAAALSTAAVMLVVILPVLVATWLLVRQAVAFIPPAKEWVTSIREANGGDVGQTLPAALEPIFTQVEAFFATWEIDLQGILAKNLDLAAERASGLATRIVKNTFLLVFNLFVMGFGLFFFFRDGRSMVAYLVDHAPLERTDAAAVIERLDRTLAAVVRGVLVTAVVQGLLAGFGFAVVGLRFAVLLGVATSLLALIPFVGAAAIWIPAAGWLFATGEVGRGIFLAAWGLLVVSLVDNFLKPILIGERANMSTFLLFFGILGGLRFYGFLGILIGPLLIASVLAFAKIFREQLDRLANESPSSG